ncbi:UDP-N-acetylmuramoyl-L-alanine--D-glutamate ligase [Granulicella arctica]|uniref:UDP-N-acetylmuramoylalanine--D-glutamate ligase n=1 Tax=Granulicella arctica TaxID=940613 RepID=A0A7Y9TUW2_9BACT|nr:UDP-N-acetylmuramoyl-L-alanine--D-glutamate ligase [Granulicella arctica]NYF81193.1 UDP-N-acetylmuramoylalanine--D-glutamate ligase [Granulicella arctica]
MELKDKRVLVVGLGKSGLAAALFLRGQGARVTVSDARSSAALAGEIPALLEAGIMVEAGGHGLLTFRRQDLIVASPGVPLDTPEVKQVMAYGMPVIGELELASRYLQGKVVAITGSNGKTTTTSLVGKILSDAGLPTQVGGNIGLPVIELIAESKAETVNVLEVSSFQLETVVEFHPQIAAILNLTPDHLDRHGSFENYVAAKEKIFARQTAEDALVLNADDRVVQMCASKVKSQVFWFSGTKVVRQGAFVRDGVVAWVAKEGGMTEPVMPVSEIALKGAHNVENVLAAVCMARIAGVAAESIRASVASFRAVEHRLEFVADVDGVAFYNDSKATNVDATMKAVASFAGGVHLILGGKDKDSDYSLLAPLLRERVKAVYTIGSAAEKIERQLQGVVKMVEAGTMEVAVAEAAKAAAPGDVVLLAPACSSYDQFENYEHRGRVFRELVEARRT